ncbi:NAD(P)/FAD-dependent oxidoreductase [Paenibacillus yanchengensis]|uniref:Ferredoxin--NADP reductase n=1 Tax=Paenibacillus yanchengensis TaxID=2035833 RepID=A0ABW4YLG7_9BACL
MVEQEQIFDITIIGGGPAGLFSAFYSGLREMKTKIIEFQPRLGGKVHVYPEKMIWDVGGIVPVPAATLIEQMTAQALTFEPEVVLGQKVTYFKQVPSELNPAGAGSDHSVPLFEIHTASGEKHYSRTIIIAVGGGILQPTKLNITGAERFELTNLHYTVKSLERFKDKIVLISGGGNAAIDWANELEPIAKQIYLTYRQDALKGHEAQVSKLHQSSVECLLNTTIERLDAAANHEKIEKVVLQHQETGEFFELAVDEVIINHGYERDKTLLQNEQFPLELAEEHYIAGNPLSETSIKGIYAAGDILHHEGKLHLIAGAFQDAANAVNQAKQLITPDARKYGMVSSHNDLFAKKNKELLKHLYQPAEVK